MKLHLDFHDSAGVLKSGRPVALTIGNFDGVHVGHRTLLAELRAWAKELSPVVLTFDPHPGNFFKPGTVPLLSTVDDRIELLLDAGASAVVVCRFDEELSRLEPSEFLRELVASGINIQNVLVGHDFRFGSNRKGDFDFLVEFARTRGWQVREFHSIHVGNHLVSSSLIRKAVCDGDVRKASQLLGRRFSLPGVVVSGDQRGRKIGFPTVNLQVSGEMVRPRDGVYAGYVKVDCSEKPLPAVMNLGHRPTFGEHQEFRSEAHILDFEGDLYGQKAAFILEARIRSEEKFLTLDDLVHRIREDILCARGILR